MKNGGRWNQKPRNLGGCAVVSEKINMPDEWINILW
jgi:hypothetical protein